MPEQPVRPNTVTVSPVADGLAYVYGRVIVEEHGGAPRWEYLGSSASREDALERARRTADGGELWVDQTGGRGEAPGDGIAPTRPPADS